MGIILEGPIEPLVRMPYSFLAEAQRRIGFLEDCNCYIKNYKPNKLEYIYSVKTTEDEYGVVRCRPFDHTMFDSIDLYCRKKFPIHALKKAISNNYSFKIFGVFPQHFRRIAKNLGFTIIRKIQYKNNPTSKRINYMRPEFYEVCDSSGSHSLIVVVGCGRDYVLHYSSMLRHVLDIYTNNYDFEIVRFPLAESSLPLWTGIDSDMIRDGDTVIIGYIDEVEQELDRTSFEKVGNVENDYYISIVYQNKKTTNRINLFGVKYSFWGDISARIATQFCLLGANEIIYVGKLGELISPKFVYNKIFSPSEFIIMYHDKIISWIDDLANNFLTWRPEFDTGIHVSVPTILEEDYIQREATEYLNISSIDNEISQIAFAIKKYNNLYNKNVSFSAIHLATDYIRKNNEKSEKSVFDLSNNRSPEAKELRRHNIERISKILANYLEETK